MGGRDLVCATECLEKRGSVTLTFGNRAACWMQDAGTANHFLLLLFPVIETAPGE